MVHVAFATLPVLDLDRAIAFWRDVMGAAVSVDIPFDPPGGAASRFVLVEFPGARTQIHLNPVDTLPVTDRPALPLVVGDVAAEERRLSALGVEIVTPPTPAPWDPDTVHALIRETLYQSVPGVDRALAHRQIGTVLEARATAREGYLDHPTHLPVAALIGEWAERLVVFDLSA